ncbi:hypothetical protein KXX32_002231, partial [Aspergillus fumigatus]
MLFSRVAPVALLVALATSSLGAVSAKQAIKSINALQNTVSEARRSIKGWNSSLLGVIPVASKLQEVKTSATNTRRTIEQSNAFGEDNQEDVLAAYQQLHPEIIGALNAAEEKAPAFKVARVAFMARAMMDDLKSKKEKFKTTIQGKVPAE